MAECSTEYLDMHNVKFERDDGSDQSETTEKCREKLSNHSETSENQPKENAIQKRNAIGKKVEKDLSKELKNLQIKVEFSRRQRVKMFSKVQELTSEVDFLNKIINDLKAANASLQTVIEEHNLDSFVGGKKKETIENYVSGTSQRLYNTGVEIGDVKTECTQLVLNEDQGRRGRGSTRSRRVSSRKSSSRATQPCKEEDVTVAASKSTTSSHPVLSDGDGGPMMADDSSNHSSVQDLTITLVPPDGPSHDVCFQGSSLSKRSNILAERRQELPSSFNFATGEKAQDGQIDDVLQKMVSENTVTADKDFHLHCHQGKEETVFGGKFNSGFDLGLGQCAPGFSPVDGPQSHERVSASTKLELWENSETCQNDPGLDSSGSSLGKCLSKTQEKEGKILEIDDLEPSDRKQTEGKPYACDVCGARYAYPGSLWNHKRAHSGDALLKGDVFSPEFSETESLERQAKKDEGQNVTSQDNSWHPKIMQTREKPYKCTVCSAKFAFKNSLENHKKLHSPHTSKKHYTCEVCGAKFANTSSLYLHRKSHPEVKFHKCRFCGEKFTDRVSLQIHRKTHGEKPYKCDLCGAGYTSTSGLNSHRLLHSGERPYKCDVCGDSFTQNVCLKRHKRKHVRKESAPDIKSETGNAGSAQSVSSDSGKRKEKLFICEVCGASYVSLSNLTNHEKTHFEEKPFKCKICRARFPEKESLDSHMEIHKGQKTYSCDVCNKMFLYKSSLSTHRKIHTGERPYACKICNARYQHKSSLNAHERRHLPHAALRTGPKVYSCVDCGAEFDKRNLLQKHRKIHKPAKPFVCEFCGTSFAQAGTLQSHRRRHTGEKPFKCEFCGAEFAQGNSLRSHLRTHTGEKPYKCDMCSYSCAVQSNLLLHKRRRHQERPYVCEICGARFINKTILDIHKRNHTGEKPYKCDICNVAFACSNYLSRHYKGTHKMRRVPL